MHRSPPSDSRESASKQPSTCLSEYASNHFNHEILNTFQDGRYHYLGYANIKERVKNSEIALNLIEKLVKKQESYCVPEYDETSLIEKPVVKITISANSINLTKMEEYDIANKVLSTYSASVSNDQSRSSEEAPPSMISGTTSSTITSGASTILGSASGQAGSQSGAAARLRNQNSHHTSSNGETNVVSKNIRTRYLAWIILSKNPKFLGVIEHAEKFRIHLRL